MSIQTINPATEELLETFEVYSQEQVDQALNEAREAICSVRETCQASAQYCETPAGLRERTSANRCKGVHQQKDQRSAHC